MTVARSVADVLTDHVVFEVECIDRMYLNVYVPGLQYEAGLVAYVHQQLGLPIASTAPLAEITHTFSAGVHRFGGREATVRQEAAEVRDDLGLEARLRRIAVPVIAGSAALHVMVHRDLDITATCRAFDAPTAVAITALGAAPARHPRVWQSGSATTPGCRTSTLTIRTAGTSGCISARQRVAEWTLDLWFVDDPDRQPDFAHLQ